MGLGQTLAKWAGGGLHFKASGCEQTLLPPPALPPSPAPRWPWVRAGLLGTAPSPFPGTVGAAPARGGRWHPWSSQQQWGGSRGCTGEMPVPGGLAQGLGILPEGAGARGAAGGGRAGQGREGGVEGSRGCGQSWGWEQAGAAGSGPGPLPHGARRCQLRQGERLHSLPGVGTASRRRVGQGYCAGLCARARRGQEAGQAAPSPRCRFLPRATNSPARATGQPAGAAAGGLCGTLAHCCPEQRPRPRATPGVPTAPGGPSHCGEQGLGGSQGPSGGGGAGWLWLGRPLPRCRSTPGPLGVAGCRGGAGTATRSHADSIRAVSAGTPAQPLAGAMK